MPISLPSAPSDIAFPPFDLPDSLAGDWFGFNIGGAEGAKHIAEALKVNTTLTSIKYVTPLPRFLLSIALDA